jgi:hypothetical protein
MNKKMSTCTPCIFYLAMVCSMLCNAHGSSYRPVYNPLFLKTHATNNRTVTQNATAQNTVPQDTFPENTDNLFDTKRIIANANSGRQKGLSTMEKLSAAGVSISALGVTGSLTGVALTNSDKIKKFLNPKSEAKVIDDAAEVTKALNLESTTKTLNNAAEATKGLNLASTTKMRESIENATNSIPTKALSRGKAARILGVAALIGAGAAGAAKIARKTRATKACAAHIIDQLRNHNFVGQLFFDKVDGEPSLHGIQCNYYNTISGDPVVEETVFNLYKNLPNKSVQKNVSLFKKHCKESKRGQCNTTQTVCLTNLPKIC